VIYCKRCVTPDTRPRIEFDDEGICNACRYAEQKQRINWTAKTKELKEIAKMYKSKKVKYDCIVPASGGKDSHFQAYYAKNILELNPLVVTFMPAMPTEIGNRNRRNLVEKVGVDHIAVTPNSQIHRQLCRIMFREHGNPFLPWIQGIFSSAAQIAVEKDIPLILYGENGEAEYGGTTKGKESESLDEGGVKLRVRSDRHNWIGPHNWHKYGIPKKDLIPYIEPSLEKQMQLGLRRLFMGDYVPWSNNQNLYFAMNVIGGFKLSEKRTVGTYTCGASIDDDIDEIYLWLLWVKFGFARASKSGSPDIREGKLDRKTAIELVRRYDGEFPWHVFDSVLEYLEIDEEEFWETIRRFVGDQENIARERQEALEMGIPEVKIRRRVCAWEKIDENKWRHVGTIHGEERILEVSQKRPTKISL